jgi:hypothetical protein
MSRRNRALGAPARISVRVPARSAHLLHRPLEEPLRAWTVTSGPGSAYLRLLAETDRKRRETAPVDAETVSTTSTYAEVSDGCSI